MAGKKTKSKARQTDINAKYGPLRGTEWLELDHWAFQEFPRKAYALFHDIVRYHKVPLKAWLKEPPSNHDLGNP